MSLLTIFLKLMRLELVVQDSKFQKFSVLVDDVVEVDLSSVHELAFVDLVVAVVKLLTLNGREPP